MKKKLEYQKYLNQKQFYEKKVNKVASLRMIAFLIMIFSFILKYYYYKVFWETIFILSLVSFFILVIIHDKYFKKYHYYASYLNILENYLQRASGEWKKFKDTGEEFLKEENHYLRDLDVLGQKSLFQYLCICKTIGGKRRLFQKLSNENLDTQKLVATQQAVEELSKSKEFIINYQIALAEYQNKAIDLSTIFSTYTKDHAQNVRDYLIAAMTMILLITFFCLSLFHFISVKYFYGLFLFNYLISFMYSLIYHHDFDKMTNLVRTYHQIPYLANIILKENFTSKKLQKIKKEVFTTSEMTKKINFLDSLNSIKDNLLFNFLFNGLFCINLISRSYFNLFLKKDFPKLKSSINDMEELEALISLSTIGILKENICMPTKWEKVSIEFKEIKHPLLEENICVANDFESDAGVNIITGSNMGGKTSFLRTIGINLILMNAGTFTCATSFSSAYFKIFTSMRINDDIEKGISTFYGELLRIKEALSYLEKGNMIVLIDEIFKGTNYQDRIYGAKKVIQRLQNKQVITFLTTHDFELCDEKNIKNYHVKEYYEGDKIQFDYKIRPGKCTSTNAKYLMEKLNII